MNTYKIEWMKPRTCFNVDKLYAWKNGLPFSPVFVEISMTKKCNQKCIYCYVDSCNSTLLSSDGLSEEVVLRLIDDLADSGVNSIGFQGTGEPLLNKALSPAVKRAAERGLTVTLTTNGVLLDAKRNAEQILQNIQRVIFSGLDIDVDRYSYQHDCAKSHLPVVIRNMKAAVEYKKRMGLDFGVVGNVFITPQNWTHLYEIAKFYKEIGVDVINIADIFNSERGPSGGNGTNSVQIVKNGGAELDEILKKISLLEDDSFFTRISLVSNKTDSFGPDVKERLGHCEGIKFKTLIDSDGNVIPCARGWGDERHYLGNINNASFSEIWNSERTKVVFEYINRPIRDEVNCCLCQNVAINTILTDYMKPHRFIHVI